jgi:hypothetical protein
MNDVNQRVDYAPPIIEAAKKIRYKTMPPVELEELKLPIPNPYGKTVKIERVNMLIERAYKAGQAIAQAKKAAAERDAAVMQCYLEVLAVGCGETEYSEAIRTKFGLQVHTEEAEPKKIDREYYSFIKPANLDDIEETK